MSILSNIKKFTRYISRPLTPLSAAWHHERKTGYTNTKKVASDIFWFLVAPYAVTVITKKAHIRSAHKLGITGDIKQIGKEYKSAVSVPRRARNELANTFIRRARVIDILSTIVRVAVMIRATRD